MAFASSASMTASCHGRARRSVCRAARSKCATGFRPMEVAVEDCDPVQAGLEQDRYDRSRPRLRAGPHWVGHREPVPGRRGLEPGTHAGHGIGTVQPSVLVHDDVDGAHSHFIRQETDERRRLFLVWRSDHGSHHVGSTTVPRASLSWWARRSQRSISTSRPAAWSAARWTASAGPGATGEPMISRRVTGRFLVWRHCAGTLPRGVSGQPGRAGSRGRCYHRRRFGEVA